MHAGHFAFMRALIQGMDARASWDRYLAAEGEGGDRRQVQRTIAWIKDAFAAAARREHRPGTARLILFDASRVVERASQPLPALAEFAHAQGLEDFSEDEQLEAYLAAYPDASRASPAQARGAPRRRARVVERQLDALRWLEHLVIHEPRPSDPIGAWLSPRLSHRLAQGGLVTLGDLVARMNAQGGTWWRACPGVGEHKAAYVAGWVRDHLSQLGLALSPFALDNWARLPAAQKATLVVPAMALRPLEKLIVPPSLDGRDGSNRELGASSDLSNDIEAIQRWVDSKAAAQGPGQEGVAVPSLTATQRSYRREAERLLLWGILVRGKALASLDAEDAGDYLTFIAVPPASWCGPRGGPRWSPHWRPFEGPLSVAARRQAVVILHGLFAHLVRQRYLRTNAFAAQLAAVRPRPDVDPATRGDTSRAIPGPLATPQFPPTGLPSH
ncbi:Phage integrase protein [Xylophilus ampelinus]|nr:Phage integrase protein [Xylophilus ampelinus]